jgi:two-component system LytT family response regulator
MINAVIIDDDPFCIEDIQYLITKHELPVNIVATANSALEGIEIINRFQPDLVFLDIVMPGMTGFDMLDHLSEINFKLVITTSIDKFAVQAIRASAIDFLVKPIKAAELTNTIERVLASQEAVRKPQIELLHNQINQKSGISKIAISISDGVQFVKIEDIMYLKSDGNYTTFYFKNTKNLLVSKQIGKFEDMLEGTSFFRIHASYLINVHYVSKFIRSDGGYVIMENGEQISVARNRKDDFLQMMQAL